MQKQNLQNTPKWLLHSAVVCGTCLVVALFALLFIFKSEINQKLASLGYSANSSSAAQNTGKTNLKIRVYDMTLASGSTTKYNIAYRPAVLIKDATGVEKYGEEKSDVSGPYYLFKDFNYGSASELEIKVRLSASSAVPGQDNFHYFFRVKPVDGGYVKQPGSTTDEMLDLYPWYFKITNAASGTENAFTKNSLVAIYGRDFFRPNTFSNCAAKTKPLPTNINGVSINIDSYLYNDQKGTYDYKSTMGIPLTYACEVNGGAYTYSQVNAYIPDADYKNTYGWRRDFILNTGIDWNNQVDKIRPVKIQPLQFTPSQSVPGMFTTSKYVKNLGIIQMLSIGMTNGKPDPAKQKYVELKDKTTPAKLSNSTSDNYLVIYITGLGNDKGKEYPTKPVIKIDGDSNKLIPIYAGDVYGIDGQQQINVKLPNSLDLSKGYDKNDPTKHIIQICDGGGNYCTSPGMENPSKAVYVYITK